jgi:hypothetical protein
VVHPGGRNYEHFPVNALEAEARRVARFDTIGHSHGQLVAPPLFETEPRFQSEQPQTATGISRFQRRPAAGRSAVPPPPKPNVSYPYTLDLRYDG